MTEAVARAVHEYRDVACYVYDVFMRDILDEVTGTSQVPVTLLYSRT